MSRRLASRRALPPTSQRKVCRIPAPGRSMVEAIEAGSQAGGKREGEFVVVPLPFRNALIGAGLVVGAGYLYRSADSPDNGPPSIAGVGGMYAENDTWAALAAHRGYWAKDTWRTTTGVVTGKVNYQLTLGEGSQEQEVSVTQPVSAASIEGTRRFGEHTWIGMSLGYARTDVSAVGLLVADDIELADLRLVRRMGYPRRHLCAEQRPLRHARRQAVR